MIVIVLSVLIALSAIMTIVAQYRHTKRLEYIFKPLTTSLIIVLALIEDDPSSTNFKWIIVGGLLASLAGDVFLMLESNHFMEGLASFLLAHVLYIVAFTDASDGNAPRWYIIPFVAFGAVLLWALWPHLGSMRAPVMIYVGAILLMAFQAANRWITTDTTPSLLGLIGAYLFVASDSVLAVERFGGTFRSAPFWVLSTYFAAQWFIAMSI